MPINRRQLPQSAEVLQQMVLDLIAQLDAEQGRRIKTENLLRQLLAARSEQITDEQLALFEAELKAQGVNIEGLAKDKEAGSDPDATILRPPRDAAPRRTLAGAAPCPAI